MPKRHTWSGKVLTEDEAGRIASNIAKLPTYKGYYALGDAIRRGDAYRINKEPRSGSSGTLEVF